MSGSRRAAVALFVLGVVGIAAVLLWRLRARDAALREVTVYWQTDGVTVRPRVEACTTCHTAHPKAEALVAAHPLAAFGCTSCHGGEGTPEHPHPRVVLRARADGTGEEWAADGFEAGERREALLRLGGPMPEPPAPADGHGRGALAVPVASRDAFLRALPEVQGGCLKCHAGDDEIEGAPELARGRTLFRVLGCQACHVVTSLPPQPKPGLPLDDIARRLTPGRLLDVLRDPRAVDPRARMPSAWPAASDGAGDAARRDETIAVAAYLFDRSERRARERGGGGGWPSVARASEVAGASAEDGRHFYEAYGCTACHDAVESAGAPARTLAPSLAAAGDGWTPDWLAAWSRDPKAIYAGARMPSLRLSPREAASVAQYLATRHGTARAAAEDVAIVTNPARRDEIVSCAAAASAAPMPRTRCGELLTVRHACVACHDLDGVEGPRALGPSLDGFATRARLTPRVTFTKLATPQLDDANARMPDYALAASELRALLVLLAGFGDAAPVATADASQRPEHRAREVGRARMRELECAGCHDAGRVRGVPPLAGEGARARPEWIFALLERPERHGVRPALHPEWLYGDLVPPASLAPRMPSYALAPDDATALVRALAAEAGARFPFAPPRPAALSPDERAHAAEALNAQCLGCHYTGELPRERARAGASSGAPLAPSLSVASERLRDDWLRAFLPTHVQKPPKPLPPKLADFVLWLRPGTVLPRPGEESRTPVLGLGD